MYAKHMGKTLLTSYFFLYCLCLCLCVPSAIYLAKKNIRKQGELMEYEKVSNMRVC